LGGTQRTTQRIGKGLAKYLILTGKMLTAADAADIGLVDAVISQEEAFDIFDGTGALPSISKPKFSGKWEAIRNLYERNKFSAIISGDYVNGNLNGEDVAKLGKTMTCKAPIALRIAEQLIEAGEGPASELDHLATIFSTSDALLGLTSIGRQVAFEGK
jgi:enoyl-CoA hydratase/carnithine racemase